MHNLGTNMYTLGLNKVQICPFEGNVPVTGVILLKVLFFFVCLDHF